MFTIKTKADYGLIIMLDLAKNYKKDFLPLSNILKEKNISNNYLTQIAQYFLQAGLIISREGSGGGYKLSRPPQKISILEILEAIEGHEISIKCLSKKKEKCSCEKKCDTRKAWQGIVGDIKKVLGRKKLSDLIKK